MIDSNFTYGIAGLWIYAPSKRWMDAGVRAGDVLVSTSLTHALNSSEKIHEALSSPAGTELVLQRMVDGALGRVEVKLK